MISLRDIQKEHYQWIKDMGWNNKTPLEELALICSEVGEAVNECRGEIPTENLGEELADIILRTLAVASGQNIDIEYECIAKMAKNVRRGTRGRVK